MSSAVSGVASETAPPARVNQRDIQVSEIYPTGGEISDESNRCELAIEPLITDVAPAAELIRGHAKELGRFRVDHRLTSAGIEQEIRRVSVDAHGDDHFIQRRIAHWHGHRSVEMRRSRNPKQRSDPYKPVGQSMNVHGTLNCFDKCAASALTPKVSVA